ncbi:MAG: hypothetical protein K1060chlam1_00386 [Candidatus Anoxychlamydiales bacterium]|nr:hypothetical protein [Candidatus Anoxychlamydiales bacterium]
MRALTTITSPNNPIPTTFTHKVTEEQISANLISTIDKSSSIDQKFKIFNLTTVKNLAIKIVKIAAIILAASAISHLISMTMIQTSNLLSNKASTSPLSKLSNFLMQGGLKIQKLAETLFLSVSVPTYMIFYKAPKYLLSKIPALIKTINRYISKFIDLSMKYVINPLINQITKFINFLKPYIISFINKIAKIINFIEEKIIKPLVNWIWKVISKAFSSLYNKVIDPLLKLTKEGIIWISRNIAKPFARWSYRVLSTALSNLYNKVIYPLLKLTKQSYQWVTTKIIFPLLKWGWKITSKASSIIYRNVIYPIASKCFLAIKSIAQKTAEISTILYKKTIGPLVDLTILAIQKTTQKIIETTNRIIRFATIKI